MTRIKYAVAAGMGVAIPVALAVVSWEWFQNPGEIYRDAGGTNWPFVTDTAMSWFIPLFFGACVSTWLGLYLWNALSKKTEER